MPKHPDCELQYVTIDLVNPDPAASRVVFRALLGDTVLFLSTYDYEHRTMSFGPIDPKIDDALNVERAFNEQHLIAMCIAEAARQSAELCV